MIYICRVKIAGYKTTGGIKYKPIFEGVYSFSEKKIGQIWLPLSDLIFFFCAF